MTLIEQAMADPRFQFQLARLFGVHRAMTDPDSGYVCRACYWRDVTYILSISPPGTPIKPGEKF